MVETPNRGSCTGHKLKECCAKSTTMSKMISRRIMFMEDVGGGQLVRLFLKEAICTSIYWKAQELESRSI